MTALFLLLPLVLMALAIIYKILSVLCNIFFSSLKNVPGPISARFTDLCFNHPKAAQIIYGVGKTDKFAKSSFYRAFTTPNPNQPSMFSHKHIKEHAQLRRLCQSTHAMSALISYEDFVDECSDLFDQRLREMAGGSASARVQPLVDFGRWFQCYAFDVISLIIYSTRLGFLDQGVDIAGIMESLEGFLSYASVIGVYS
ncbi:hypothetical protein ACHAQD_010287 [Fusarium lateritium]